MAMAGFLGCLLAAGWLLLRAGGSPLVLEGLVVTAAWSTLLGVELVDPTMTPAGVVCLAMACGGFLGCGYYLAQGRGRVRGLRMVVINVGATALFVGTKPGATALTPSVELGTAAAVAGMVAIVASYLVLAHTRLGLTIRAAGTAPELLRRLGRSVRATQALAFAVAGALVGCAAACKGGGPMDVVGFGYVAFGALVVVRWLVVRILNALSAA